jgi:hypothetical protein
MNFNINFVDFAKNLLPPFLKQVKFLTFLKSLCLPITTVNHNLNNYINDTLYKVSFTGQIIYLEHILNDYFDDSLRRIYIDDGLQLGLPPYIYNKIETRPKYTYNKSEIPPANVWYLRNRSEYFAEDDFIVFVPVSILTTPMERAIKSLVLRYKLAGKRFSVQTF